jgi:hypothetical protein
MNNPLMLIMNKPAPALMSSDESSEEDQIEYIISEKPKTKIVREFFRNELASIMSEEEKLFNK